MSYGNKKIYGIYAVLCIIILGMSATQVSANNILPDRLELFIHYMQELVTEKITELTGVGSTAKTEIEAASETEQGRMGSETPEPEETTPATSTTTQPTEAVKQDKLNTETPATPETSTTQNTRTSATPASPATTAPPATPSSPATPTSSATPTSPATTEAATPKKKHRNPETTQAPDHIEDSNLWRERFNEYRYITDLLNSDTHITGKLKDLGDETILVAIIDDSKKITWKKKIGLREGHIQEPCSGEPTTWIKINAEAAESLYNARSNGAGRDTLIKNMIKQWRKDEIKIYPLNKAGEIYLAMNDIIHD